MTGRCNEPTDEIEITPRMIEAGLKELSYYYPSEDDEATAEGIIKEIFVAMLRCQNR